MRFLKFNFINVKALKFAYKSGNCELVQYLRSLCHVDINKEVIKVLTQLKFKVFLN